MSSDNSPRKTTGSQDGARTASGSESTKQHLSDRVSDLEDRVEELAAEVAVYRNLFDESIIDRARGHAEAASTDVRKKFSQGDEFTVIIEEVDESGPRVTGITHIEGVVVFIQLPSRSVQVGDEMEILLTDVEANQAHAIPKRGDNHV